MRKTPLQPKCSALQQKPAILVERVNAITYRYLRKPAVAPASSIKVPMTPERIARREHIFTYVADCDGCHSQRDFSRFDGPVVPGGRGRGNIFPVEMGLPGTVVAPNITMSDEDVQSLVAYMNTLAPVRNPLPRTKINFPVNLMIKGAPRRRRASP